MNKSILKVGGFTFIRLFLFFLVIVAILASSPKIVFAQAEAKSWKRLASGVEYRVFDVKPKPAISDGKLHVVRIDPEKAQLKLVLASELDKQRRMARGWCKDSNLLVAINAG